MADLEFITKLKYEIEMDNKDKKWLGWRPQFQSRFNDSDSVFFGCEPKQDEIEVDISNTHPTEWDENHKFVHRNEDLPPPELGSIQQAIWLAKRKLKK